MIKRKTNILIAFLASGLCCQSVTAQLNPKIPSYSGIYPSLAMYNNEGECGTGAVVPWAGSLWAITYAPHKPNGSSDKLYQISPGLKQTVRAESIGGTPANRMIHSESNQLFIGPYAVSSSGQVRTIPYTQMAGRHTGNARHLSDPAGKIYYGTMEEGFYEVDVNSLKVKELYPDGNAAAPTKGADSSPLMLDGAHGKGLYSGQGVMVYSNNGETGKLAQQKFDIEAGSLSEWDGKNWKLVRRNQFVEVTGPGGIYGNKNPGTDPIWATGWDHKSVLLAVRYENKWSFYRLPKASHSYDGAHGWNTEWPRIRDIGTPAKPDYLMTMHGLFWRFPATFTPGNAYGIRPRSAYLKVIGDFTRWGDKLVFGCDDSAQKEFLNKRKAKGGIEGPGQSNSNLWFTSISKPDELGPATAEGAVWVNERVKGGEPSEPFLFQGWARRSAWIQNHGGEDVVFTLETDINGNGKYTRLRDVKVGAGRSVRLSFNLADKGEWVRIRSDKNTTATAHFYYASPDARGNTPDAQFAGLTSVGAGSANGGLLYGLGDDRRVLGIAARKYNGSQFTETGYYELNADMKLERKDDPKTYDFVKQKFAVGGQDVTVEESSVLVIDDAGRRWRLPLGNSAFTGLTQNNALRICREVATERDLFNCHGTFYELPAENADGYAKIRPVSTHNYRINDYASYRGLLVLTGLDVEKAAKNPHVVVSEDKQAAVWAGAIDDLWKLGKPVGQGGPWKNTSVQASEASDPYLIGFYDQKSLSLSHKGTQPVTFTIEVDPIGNGPWMEYKTVTVQPGKPFNHQFPTDFQARWIRFKADKDCKATANLIYQ